MSRYNHTIPIQYTLVASHETNMASNDDDYSYEDMAEALEEEDSDDEEEEDALILVVIAYQSRGAGLASLHQ